METFFWVSAHVIAHLKIILLLLERIWQTLILESNNYNGILRTAAVLILKHGLISYLKKFFRSYEESLLDDDDDEEEPDFAALSESEGAKSLMLTSESDPGSFFATAFATALERLDCAFAFGVRFVFASDMIHWKCITNLIIN